MKTRRILILSLILALLNVAFAQEADPLTLTLGGADVAHVLLPDGYSLLEGVMANSDDAEYYLAPDDPDSPVRFLYYTAGTGDSRALAEAAVESYTVFYDSFNTLGVQEAEFAEKSCVLLTYTCGYPGQDGSTMVYEQSAIVYLPAGEDTFVACILSLAFQDEEHYLDEDALSQYIETMVSAVENL